MTPLTTKNVVLIVAHPDDETLWAGGTLLSNPSWTVFIVCLCRGSDPDRAPRFHQALKVYRAEGSIGDLDDGPEQKPIGGTIVAQTIRRLLPQQDFDLIITHNPHGEYTRHRRHEETSKAVIELWQTGKITAPALWTFAYEDGNKQYLPKAIENKTFYCPLPEVIWLKKYNIITHTYGFEKESWEAQTTPKAEAFWQFTDPAAALKSEKF